MLIMYGLLMTTVDVVPFIAEPGVYIPYLGRAVVEVDMGFQLFHMNGTPLSATSATYNGKGEVVNRGGKRIAIVGNPYRDVNLEEFTVAPKANVEDEARFAVAVSATRAALNEFKPKARRVPKAYGEYPSYGQWLEYYDKAIAERKRVDAQ